MRMHRLIALALLLPLSGHAQILFVDYEGVVDQAGDNPLGYRVGDAVKGRLLVDLLLAPAELFPNTSELASYHILPPEPQRDWIRGYTAEGGSPADRIFVTNNGSSGDWFSIGDRRDQGGDAFRGIEIIVGGLEMFPTNQLTELPAFTVTREDTPATFHAGLTWAWGQATQFVSVALKRFSVKPGSCKAPS